MSNINIGLSMLYCLGENFESLIKRLQKVNISRIELIDEGLHSLNKNRVRILKDISHSHDLKITVHAPFVDINIAYPNLFLRRTALRILKRSMKHANDLNCKLWIFHPGRSTGVSLFYPNLDWRLNLDAIQGLSETAREYGLQITVENLPEPFPFLLKSVEDFKRFYMDCNCPIGLTVDIGHANVNQQILDFIHEFPNKIVHIHVSDNDGTFDHHQGIGWGNIQWSIIAENIKRINYKGAIILESYDHIKESLNLLAQFFT